jgi:hypothetical protein
MILFKKFTLCMFWIVISWRITNPSIEHRCDNVTYILCIFSGTLLGRLHRSMIKWSNVCPSILKFVRQKVGAIDNWYLSIVNVLEVFNYNIWWWYWKLLNMGPISMAFLGGFQVVCLVNYHVFEWNY